MQFTVTCASPLSEDLQALHYFKSSLFYPTDHKAEDTDATISFSKSPSNTQEETTEKDATRLALNNGFPKGDFVVVDHQEDETSETHKVGKDFKTTVNQTDISGQFLC